MCNNLLAVAPVSLGHSARTVRSAVGLRHCQRFRRVLPAGRSCPGSIWAAGCVFWAQADKSSHFPGVCPESARLCAGERADAGGRQANVQECGSWSSKSIAGDSAGICNKFLLRKNSFIKVYFTYKIHPFQVCTSVISSNFTKGYSHHPKLVMGHFQPPRKVFSSPLFPPLALGNH